MAALRAASTGATRPEPPDMEFTDYLPMMLAMIAAFAVIVVVVVLVMRRGKQQ